MKDEFPIKSGLESLNAAAKSLIFLGVCFVIVVIVQTASDKAALTRLEKMQEKSSFEDSLKEVVKRPDLTSVSYENRDTEGKNDRKIKMKFHAHRWEWIKKQWQCLTCGEKDKE